MASVPSLLSRRALLAGAFATACGRKLGTRYQGWLLVASGSERAIAVANLAQFRRVEAIALPHSPDQLYFSRDRVFATSRQGAKLIEIEPARFRVAGETSLPGKPISARILPDGVTALVITDQAPSVLLVDLIKRQVSARLSLPAAPADADLNGSRVAVTLPSRHSIARIAIPDLKNPALKLIGETDLGVSCEPVRFRADGKVILAGAPAAREIVMLDIESGLVLAKLSLPIAPSRFCFNNDGGQMFVTGIGEDAVSILNTYQNEVDQTILAGRTPGAMAVSAKNLLFVANAESGDLTILDIETRRLSASVHVGEHPGEILLTPDGEYALVLDTNSGNVSVVRITTVLDHKNRTKPLFTVFPTAPDARSAIIVPFRT